MFSCTFNKCIIYIRKLSQGTYALNNNVFMWYLWSFLLSIQLSKYQWSFLLFDRSTFFQSKSTFKKIFPTMSHPQITNSSLIDHWLFNHRSNEFKCSLVCAGTCPFFLIDMIELAFKNNNKKPLSLFTWKHSSDILVHADMRLHPWCRSPIQPHLKGALMGSRSTDCGDQWSTVN